MPSWVLILFLVSRGGAAIETVPFSSLERCQAAARAAIDLHLPGDSTVAAVCARFADDGL